MRGPLLCIISPVIKFKSWQKQPLTSDNLATLSFARYFPVLSKRFWSSKVIGSQLTKFNFRDARLDSLNQIQHPNHLWADIGQVWVYRRYTVHGWNITYHEYIAAYWSHGLTVSIWSNSALRTGGAMARSIIILRSYMWNLTIWDPY